MIDAAESYEAFKRWRESWYQQALDFAKRCRDADRQRRTNELQHPSAKDGQPNQGIDEHDS